LVALVIIALVGAFLVIRDIKIGGLPEYNGEVTIETLSDSVTIYRDERGMPHIYAENEHDLYFSTGYVMAQERLWQMDLIRRATTGRLSEIFGSEYVETDLFLRSLDMTTKSKMILSTEDPVIIECMQAFADGVNYYISHSGKKLPPEFRILGYKPDPWKLEDMANIIGYMGWDLAAGNLAADIFNYRLVEKLGEEKASRLIPDWKAINTFAFPDFKLEDEELKDALLLIASMEKLESLGIHSFSGSNNWAVSGSKTETGMPVLSNDMHLGLNSPGIWMQIHEVVPGKLDVTGVAVPGQPFIVAGHNSKIAWGMTNLMVDDIDLFAETINPENENQYFFNGEWKNLLLREEIINIKGEEPDTLVIKSTHRGPLISGFRDINDAVLSMRWSGYDKSNELKAVYKLNRATNWDEFREAISNFNSISQNFAYADVAGNIGLNTGGGVPVRKGFGSIIRNGETEEFDWKGFVPFEQLPSSFNPPSGFVSSANNKTVSGDYPFYISFRYSAPYRINRIREMLTEKEKFGIDDFKTMITDQHSNYAAMLVPFILKLKNKLPEMNSLESEAFDLLDSWDYEMRKDLVAPALFDFFRISFAKNLLGDELGDLYSQLPGSVIDYYIFRIITVSPDEWVDDINTPDNESVDDILFRSFRDGIKTLSESYGTNITQWAWGAIHTFQLEHPMGKVTILDKIFSLNSEKYPVGGSNHTVCPYSYNSSEFKVNHGASQRHIYNTANWDESWTVIPTGTSGIPGSEFYLSQTKEYLDGNFYKDAYSEEAVKAAARYKLVLRLSSRPSL
jgi:penicillin amidase